jgi:putative DNA primase/helicase
MNNNQPAKIGKPRFDIPTVRAAAATRWPEILAANTPIPIESLDGNHHPCLCGGIDRLRLIDAEAGAVLCNQCFNTRNGDGFAAIQHFRPCKFAEALALVAEHLGIEPEPVDVGKNGKPRSSRKSKKHIDPAEHLTFDETFDPDSAITWCALRKPGITPAALAACGCRTARYYGQHHVFALPVWGPKLTAAEPVGWVLYNQSGGLLPKFTKDKPVEWVKTKLTYGSQPGVIGPVDFLSALAAAAVGAPTPTTIWKTEGPTDLLALLSLADLPPDVTAITNAHGAGEKPQPWMLELFAGRTACVIHDADQPGERGAAGYDDPATGKHRPGWCELVATKALETRHVRLPYEIAHDHGPDLRDWLNGLISAPSGVCETEIIGDFRTYADLAALADASPITTPPPAVATLLPNEADDDPHRLARVNLERYASLTNGATIRFWRNEFWTWRPDRGCYHKIEIEEFKAKIMATIKAYFDELNIEQQAEEWREDPPEVHKVTGHMIGNVLSATKSMTIVPASVEQGTWLEPPTREQRSYVAMDNGVLNLGRLLEDRDGDALDDILLPHSPCWFSTVKLPYKFEGDAECPKFEKFLERSLEMDAERIKVLQEWAGYQLTADTGHQKFMILEGEGANGKSVYCAALTAMLGIENCSHVPLEQFGDRFAKTQTMGKLANISADTGEIDRLAEGYLKSMTSGDMMFWDQKGLPGFNATPTARMTLSCNSRPRISDKSSGVWRRMLIIPFKVEIPIRERVLNMDKHWWWQQSGELPGIFRWALKGLATLRQQTRFSDSAMSIEALNEYRLESNSAREFLTEYAVADPLQIIASAELYQHYRKWIDAHGNRPVNERTFGKEVFRLFPKVTRIKAGTSDGRRWHYSGIGHTWDNTWDTEQNDSSDSKELF